MTLLPASVLCSSATPAAHAAVPVSAGSGGHRAWTSFYAGAGDRDNAVHGLGVSRDGARVFVTGQTSGSNTPDDYATVAYDAASGARLWASLYNGPGNSTDIAYDLGVSPDGSTVFVTGVTNTKRKSSDYVTIAYDSATGVELWVATYDSGHSDVVFDLAVAPDGSAVYATGYSVGIDTSYDYATVGYDAATGAQLWISLYNNSGTSSDIANALDVSTDSSLLFVTGTSDSNFATIAYDTGSGAEVWVSVYDVPGTSYEAAYALAVSPDGAMVLVTGEGPGLELDPDYTTVAYNTLTGVEAWVALYHGGGHGTDSAYALEVSPDSSVVFVTGASWRSNNTQDDYATVAYDGSNGEQLWVARYNGPENNNDDPRAIRVSPNGADVFVTGFSADTDFTADFATVAYDSASGAQLWASRAGRNGDDSACALGVSPDGSRLYVGGSASILGVRYMTTIAYTA